MQRQLKADVCLWLWNLMEIIHEFLFISYRYFPMLILIHYRDISRGGWWIQSDFKVMSQSFFHPPTFDTLESCTTVTSVYLVGYVESLMVKLQNTTSYTSHNANSLHNPSLVNTSTSSLCNPCFFIINLKTQVQPNDITMAATWAIFSNYIKPL